MPEYAYRAITASGSLKEKRIEAQSESEARATLRNRGENVVHLRELTAAQASRSRGGGGRKVSADEVASTIRQMSILIRAGVPLVEGISGLSEQVKSPVLSNCLRSVASDVSHGASLSDSFAKYPAVFPKLAVEMARIAEAGGNLSESMSRLADHLENGAEIARKVKSALAYPMVVMLISVATVLTMVTFILPRFMDLFDRMGAELPLTTKALMTISTTLTTRWYLFLAGAIAVFFGLRHYINTDKGRRNVDRLLLKLPLVGDIVKKIVLSRAIASMATLLASGVPMVQTLETSAAAANNEVVKGALLKASREVSEGNATSQSLSATGIFPPLVLQMVASGEKTGELPAMLDYVCTLYGRETDAKVKSLTSIIEPVMIVVLGLIVGFIAMSVIVPIYSLVGGVK